ncbi:MAG: hypothetical protein R3202_14005, partial [Candidatus Competibacterales bacterium]|nr:hypothetical protein [Candidatus Competibacterales bacterium]
MINEGRIELRLEWRENRAHGVTLNYRRAVEVRRLLEGCEPQRVPLLVGALFGICRRAQGLTAEAACGAAAGRECRPDLPTRRAVVAELAREHLRRLLLDWPRCLGLSPWPEACRQACAALERDAAEGSMTLAPLLRRLLLEGGDPGDAPADGVAARLESVLGEAGLCGLGAVELAPLSGAALTATVPPDGPR